MKMSVQGEYFFHPKGFILAVPSENVSQKKVAEVIRHIFRRYNCLIQLEIINKKAIIRVFDRLPQSRLACWRLLNDLCKGVGIDNLELSGDLVAYDTSGKLQAAMKTDLTKFNFCSMLEKIPRKGG